MTGTAPLMHGHGSDVMGEAVLPGYSVARAKQTLTCTVRLHGWRVQELYFHTAASVSPHNTAGYSSQLTASCVKAGVRGSPPVELLKIGKSAFSISCPSNSERIERV